MEIKYEIKGITLNVWELMEIHHYYEAACTAEYIMDNYGIDDEDKAIKMGYLVRRLMDKYDYDEETAICQIIDNETNDVGCAYAEPNENALLEDLRLELSEQA